MVDEIEQQYQEKQEEKHLDHEEAEGAAGTALLGVGCLYFILLPFSFVALVIVILLIAYVFGGG